MSMTKPTSEQVTFLAAGSGATQRTALDKMRETVSVKDFGAVGDGVADDTAAIQAAVDASSSVFIPAGNYLCNGIITLPSNRTIYGAGMGATRLIRNGTNTAGQGLLFCDSGSASAFVENLNIYNLTLDGQVVSLGFSDFRHLISLHGVRNVQIRSVEFRGFRGDGLYLGSGLSVGVERHNEDVLISECLFDGVNNDNRNGITVIDGNRIRITGCTFKRCTKSGMPGPIDVEPNGDLFTVVQNIQIDGNIIGASNGGSHGIAVAISNAYTLTAPPRNFSISNNYIERPGTTGILVKMFGVVAAPLTSSVAPHAVSVANNYIRNAGFQLVGVSGATVHGNTFQGTAGTANVNPLVIGNLDAEGNCINVSVFDNQFIDTGAGFGAIGILACDKIRVCANMMYRISQSEASKFAIVFATSSGTASISSVTICDNHAVGTYDAHVRRSGAATVNLDNATTYIYDNTTDADNQWTLGNISGVTSSPVSSVSGTWTPTVVVSGLTFTYGTRTGTFTRIGDTIIAQFLVTLASSSGSPSGGVSIGGLPVAAASSNRWTIVGISNVNLPAGFTQVAATTTATSTELALKQQGDNVASADLDNAALTSTSQFAATIIYTA